MGVEANLHVPLYTPDVQRREYNSWSRKGQKSLRETDLQWVLVDKMPQLGGMLRSFLPSPDSLEGMGYNYGKTLLRNAGGPWPWVSWGLT